ncbi:MAG: pyridoxine 5'-phosphate oxidase C-terminal domain-containing protein, partial [Oligoflexus sp.]
QVVPRPEHWSGFRIVPEKIEFWIELPYRLHERWIYHRDGQGWTKTLLYP